MTWKHGTYFSDYLSNQGGLVTSLLGITAFVMAGFQTYLHRSSLVKTLYGTATSDSESVNDQSNDPKECFQAEIDKRKEFDLSYTSYLFFWTLSFIFCCCKKVKFVSRRLDRYKKFEIAVQRLSQERDI